MNRTRTGNSIRNISSGMIQKIINTLIPFVVRTILIKKLGMEYLGLNSLFSSILQVLSLTDLGFSLTISYCLYKPIDTNDYITIQGLLNFLRKVYYIVGIIIVCIGCLLLPFLENLINGSYPSDINIYVVYVIYLANTAISYFFFAYRSVLLNASQRLNIENNINSIVNIFLYIFQIIALLLIGNYYVYVIFIPISTLFNNLIKLFFCKKIFPSYYPKGNITFNEKRRINKDIKALFGHRLSYIIVNSTDSIFISIFLGLETLAIFQNYFYITSALLSIVNIIYSSLTASIGNSIILESKKKNLELLNHLTFINVLMIGWISICMMCLYQHFIFLWVGNENMLSITTVVLLVIYFYSWKFKEILSVYKDAAGMWNSDFWKPYLISILNILLDIILVKYIGLNGVLIATICSVSVLSLPWETSVVFKEYFQLKPTLYYFKLIKMTGIVFIAGMLTYWICGFIPNFGHFYFFLKLIICLIIPNVVFVLATFKTGDFKWLWKKIKQTLNFNSENK